MAMRATNAKMDFEAFGVRDIELSRLRLRGRYVKANLRFGEFCPFAPLRFPAPEMGWGRVLRLIRAEAGRARTCGARRPTSRAYVPSIVASWRVTQKGAPT